MTQVTIPTHGTFETMNVDLTKITMEFMKKNPDNVPKKYFMRALEKGDAMGMIEWAHGKESMYEFAIRCRV